MKDFNKIIQAAENKREVLKTLANKYKDSQVPVTSEMWNALVDLTTPVEIEIPDMQITGIPKTGIDRWEIGVPVATSVYPHNSFTTLNLVASGEIFATSGGGNVKVVVSYIAQPV